MLRVPGIVGLIVMAASGSLVAEQPDWQSLMATVDPVTAVAGEWSKANESLRVKAANGARIALPASFPNEYDFRVVFTRHTGQNSIGLIFSHGGKRCVFEVDAWGQHLGGFQNIAGRDMRQNGTLRNNVSLTNGQKYTMTVQVRKDRVHGLLDDDEIASFRSSGDDLSVPNLWRMPEATQLGLVAWNADTTFHSIQVRSANDQPLAMTKAPATTPRTTTPNSDTPRTTRTPGISTPPATTSATRPTTLRRDGSGRKVVIVIANQDFFYREYADPRAELEKAGIEVVVAAGRKAACRPHNNSGQGGESGVVNPDIAIADVKAADYDAILFSGGWGSSMYQFAFQGRYNNSVYNGDRRTKQQVNRVVNEFIAADKYTCALCNAVSVLAWARVDGKSPLEGKKTCAPTRAAAAGIYDGQRAQPSCRWHPEANGAIMSPAGSIGDPNTSRDDVIVDGKIITGEDDPSAREMGRRIAQVLLHSDD